MRMVNFNTDFKILICVSMFPYSRHVYSRQYRENIIAVSGPLMAWPEFRKSLDPDPINPPAPETFFVSDFHNLFKSCSHNTPEKG